MDQAEARSDFAPGNGDAKLANPLASLALDELRDTIRRPLFEEGRRPVQAPVPPAPAAPAPPPRRTADPKALTLMGILTSEGRAIALLTRNQTGQNVRAEEGDTVDGWTIERIEARHVVLRHGETKIALQIFRKR
jgi:type IV pilus biogenesis protein PilP